MRIPCFQLTPSWAICVQIRAVVFHKIAKFFMGTRSIWDDAIFDILSGLFGYSVLIAASLYCWANLHMWPARYSRRLLSFFILVVSHQLVRGVHSSHKSGRGGGGRPVIDLGQWRGKLGSASRGAHRRWNIKFWLPPWDHIMAQFLRGAGACSTQGGLGALTLTVGLGLSSLLKGDVYILLL